MSNAHKMFTKVYMFCVTGFNKGIFVSHSHPIKLEINNKRIAKKLTHSWKLNSYY